MLKKLFSPATLLMNQLRFNLKFTLIMLLFLLPLIILAYSYFSQADRISSHTQNELQALKAFKLLDSQQQALVNLLARDMAWRSGQSIPQTQTSRINNFNLGLTQLTDPELFDPQQAQQINQSISTIATDLTQRTNDLGNALWRPANMYTHLEVSYNHFNHLYLSIANLKGLTNDLEVDTVLLSRLLTEKRQLALDLILRSYAIASFAVGESQVSSLSFDALSSVSDYLDSNLIQIQNLNKLSQGLDQPLQQLIQSDIQRLMTSINNILLYIEEQFLIADEVQLNQDQLGDFFEAQLDEYYAGKALLSDELKNRLQLRLSQNSTRIFSVSIIVGLVLLLVIYLFVGMSFSIAITTNSLTNSAKRLADGDTRVHAKIHTKDELANAIRAFNQMAINVNKLVESVQSAALGVASQSDEVKRLADQTGQAVNEQRIETQAITSATNDLLAAVAVVSNNTQQVILALDQANQQTNHGKQTLIGARQATNELGDEIKHSVQVINDLSVQSENISQVLDVIKSIADQTNLLALNAAIEAARAGEQGRGFAVVADEVRSLAKRTRESTDEIQATISNLQKGVYNAVEAMTRSDEKALKSIQESAKLDAALDQISQAVEQINQQNQATEQASSEQTDIASRIEKRLNLISNISSQTEQNAQQSITASQQLAEHVDKLESVVANFKT